MPCLKRGEEIPVIDLVDAVVELAVLAVNRADDASIFPEIDRILGRVAQFDISVVFSYPPSGRPEVLHDGLKEISLPNAMGDYLAGGYLLDAVYVACKQDLPDGLYRLSALAPDAFFESEYFLSPLVHPCISMESGSLVEEIAFCARAPDETILVYSLMRSRGGVVFSEQEFAGLLSFAPLINAIMMRQWLRHVKLEASKQEGVEFSRETLNVSFRNFERERLSPREQDVVALLLRGHSSLSAAKNLGITEGTVKIHRKNIYSKLDISSQSMLFSHFIKSMIRN